MDAPEHRGGGPREQRERVEVAFVAALAVEPDPDVAERLDGPQAAPPREVFPNEAAAQWERPALRWGGRAPGAVESARRERRTEEFRGRRKQNRQTLDRAPPREWAAAATWAERATALNLRPLRGLGELAFVPLRW